MANINIVKLKVRRGTDSQRRSTLLDQGELGFTTDTKRLFVGNGVISGGVNVASKIHAPLTNTYSLTSTNAEIGDLVFANNVFWQLTGSDYSVITNWANHGPKIDSNIFSFNGSNQITISDNTISPIKLKSSEVTNGLRINGSNLEARLNASTLTLSSGEIAVKNAGITEHQLNSDAFTNGISGGSGGKIGLKFDESTLYLKYGDTLAISAIPANSIGFNNIDSSWIGSGLIYDLPNQKIKSVITDIDTASLTKNLSGKVSLQAGLMSATNELPYIRTDTYGRVLINQTAIYDTLICVGSTDFGPTSGMFIGRPSQYLSGGGVDGISPTIYVAVSSDSLGNTTTIELSSAGFITFQGGVNSRQDGKYVGRFAIPVFTF